MKPSIKEIKAAVEHLQYLAEQFEPCEKDYEGEEFEDLQTKTAESHRVVNQFLGELVEAHEVEITVNPEVYDNPSSLMDERLDAARKALNQEKYSEDRRIVYDEDIVDLITDLLHYAAANNIGNIYRITYSAINHWEAEQDGDLEDE